MWNLDAITLAAAGSIWNPDWFLIKRAIIILRKKTVGISFVAGIQYYSSVKGCPLPFLWHTYYWSQLHQLHVLTDWVNASVIYYPQNVEIFKAYYGKYSVEDFKSNYERLISFAQNRQHAPDYLHRIGDIIRAHPNNKCF